MADDPRLLVVDDEEAICQGCMRIFSHQGFQVERSCNPYEALGLAAEEDFSAVLLDVKMPGMDGIQFLEELRGKKPDLPVILITGYPSVPSAVSAVRLGISDYVTKPFTPEEIMQAVHRVLGYRDTRPRDASTAAPPRAEPCVPQEGEFWFLGESWFQVGKGAGACACAMHQPVPDRRFAGSVRVGAMLPRSPGPTTETIRLPQVGEAVYQGLPLARLIVAGRSQRTVPSPISGVVVAVNTWLQNDLAALWDDPCGKGWIACISPARFEEDVKNCRPRLVLVAGADDGPL